MTEITHEEKKQFQKKMYNILRKLDYTSTYKSVYLTVLYHDDIIIFKL